MSRRLLIALDFDGVLHGYQSSWTGAHSIPDPPVPGAIGWLVDLLDDARFDVAVFSARSRWPRGRWAMRRWLREQFAMWLDERREDHIASWPDSFLPGMDLWEQEVDWWARQQVKRIRWPFFKPPAHVLIDDRAWLFEGRFPRLEALAKFERWGKRAPA